MSAESTRPRTFDTAPKPPPSASAPSAAAPDLRVTPGAAPRTTDVVYGIVGTGQSLSVGGRSGNVPFTPYSALPVAGHRMLGNLGNPSASAWTLETLADPMRGDCYSLVWPFNVGCQAPHTAIASEIDRRSGGSYLTAHIVAGQNGQPMVGIKKGGDQPSYEGSLAEARRFQELIAAQGRRFEILAVVLTHGESDYGSTNYAGELVDLQRDYEADLQAITGQQSPIPLLLSQPSAAWPRPEGEASNIPDVMLDVSEANPSKIFLSGPKTGLSYWPSDIHLDADGIHSLGTAYGGMLADLLMGRTPAAPLKPVRVDFQPGAISVTLNRTIVLDDTLYGDTHAATHPGWRAGLGFEAHGKEGQELEIASVNIVGAAAQITLADPAVRALDVSYTLYGDGEGSVRRGQVRDGAGNWLVQFRRFAP